jgi:molecular chaperone HtpG
MINRLFGENTFKANILENLTTGMYHDSKVIYREYIQNACDSTDAAVSQGVLKSTKDGIIEIWIDNDNRTALIEDNGTGIPAEDFAEMLTTIGGSQKQFDTNKGFRGMGRLCGLGYCTTLLFTSSAKGEAIESVLTCDAVRMRAMINEHNAHTKDYTAIEVLEATTTISTHEIDDADSHYFRVELIGISDSNHDLLDKKQVEDYLTFVAPVPYRNAFQTQRLSIYEHARQLGVTIDEYNVKFDGEPIYKDYKPTVLTSKGEDTITGVDFYDFKDDNGKLIAWLWFGITKFQAVLMKDVCKARGIRLRKENIQIGDEDALQKLFKEDRGQHYFVGEVFAVDRELIPNSQRDYFNENDARTNFEGLLRRYFNGTLSKIYKDGSTVNAAIADINRANRLAEQIAETQAKGVDVDPKMHEQYKYARQTAEKKQKTLAKITEQVSKKIDSGDFQPADAVIHTIIERAVPPTLPKPIAVQPVSKPAAQAAPQPPLSKSPSLLPISPLTHIVPKTARVVSLDKVKEVILRYAKSDIANLLIAKIEEETK